MNIGFTSATGNLGKTTILINLLIALLEDYEKENINVIDGDERQTTLSDIINLRKKNKLSYVDLYTNNEDIVNVLNKKNCLNLIDLKGHLGEKEALIINKLDLIIVLSSNDKLTITKTLKYVKEFDKANITNYKVLLNQFNKKIGLDFETLKTIFKDKLLNSIVENRDSYKNYYEDGTIEYDRFLKGVFGLFRTKREIDFLKDEIILTLNKK